MKNAVNEMRNVLVRLIRFLRNVAKTESDISKRINELLAASKKLDNGEFTVAQYEAVKSHTMVHTYKDIIQDTIKSKAL